MRFLKLCGLTTPHHNPPQSTTKETPFNLVYRSDAMIPVEIQENSPRFQNFVVEESNEGRNVNLDILNEVQEEARIKAEALKRRVEHKQRSKLRPQQFQVVDLVMWKTDPYQLENKVSPKWTSPFRVIEVLENGASRLCKLIFHIHTLILGRKTMNHKTTSFNFKQVIKVQLIA